MKMIVNMSICGNSPFGGGRIPFIRCVKVSVAFWFAMVFSLAYAEDIPELSEAPLNKEFLEWVAARKKLANVRSVNLVENRDGEFVGGVTPEPRDMSHLRKRYELTRSRVPRLTNDRGTIPSSWDSRSNGLISSVKSQSPYGTCWAHATIACLETTLLKNENREYDLSENNMVARHGFYYDPVDGKFNSGGNAWKSSAYLLRWDGPLLETQDPYPNENAEIALPPAKHVQNVRVLAGRNSDLDNDRLKQAVMQYGAVHVSYYHDDAYWKKTASTAYYCGVSKATNHAVTLIGWDDSYSKYNFPSTPAGNGAFLVKNSWGKGWGDSGYFYVSYYDKTFARGTSFCFPKVEAPDNYDEIAQYDPLGNCNAFRSGSGDQYCANVFKAKKDSKICAAGFWAEDYAMEYDITVYVNCSSSTPTSGTLALTQSGTTDSECTGFQTIALSTPVSVKANAKYAIVIRFKDVDADVYAMAIEYPMAQYTPSATANAGESMYLKDGTTWTDLTSFRANANFCIKAYLKTEKPVTTYSVNYTLNGGSYGASHPTSATYDTAFYVSAPTRTGYTFAGWTVTSGLNTSTAKWGTGSSPSTAISGKSTKCVNGPTGGVYFKNLTTGSGVTLTANWTANTYSITYSLGSGGSHGATHPTSATYDKAFSVSAPTRTGYTFAGWTVTSGLNASTAKWGTGSSPSTAIDTTTKCVNGPTGGVYFKNLTTGSGVTLTANWTANTYSITYSLGSGGSHGATHPTSATYDKAFSVSAPTRTGYTFVGWTVTSGLNASTAKWGTGSSPSTAIDTTTKCVNGPTGGVYFKNLTTGSGVTLTANWTAIVTVKVDMVQKLDYIGMLGGTTYVLWLENSTKGFLVEDAWFEEAGIDISGGVTPAVMNAIGRNGIPRYESLLLGLDPESSVPAEEQLHPTITFDATGKPVISCFPRKESKLVIYTTLGKSSLNSSEWVKVTDNNRAQMKFFKVKVELAK